MQEINKLLDYASLTYIVLGHYASSVDFAFVNHLDLNVHLVQCSTEATLR
jgi:hypothetical protein